MDSLAESRRKIFFARPDWKSLGILTVMAVNGFLAPARVLDETSWRHMTGNLLICVAVMGEAVFLLLKKKLPAQLSSLAVTALLRLLGMLLFLPHVPGASASRKRVSMVREKRIRFDGGSIDTQYKAARVIRNTLRQPGRIDREHFVVMMLSTRHHIIGTVDTLNTDQRVDPPGCGDFG